MAEGWREGMVAVIAAASCTELSALREGVDAATRANCAARIQAMLIAPMNVTKYFDGDADVIAISAGAGGKFFDTSFLCEDEFERVIPESEFSLMRAMTGECTEGEARRRAFELHDLLQLFDQASGFDQPGVEEVTFTPMMTNASSKLPQHQSEGGWLDNQPQGDEAHE
ncbi:MAG: hypothetical protein E6Q76_05720 [Rhizobium sp.]|nr:MAG: hypothetical protein E6Q76_05720 [Rhizobium sp.]